MYDIVPAGREILLNTDSGLLAVTIPEKFPAGHEPAAKYHVVLTDKQGTRNIYIDDTIFFDVTNNSVQFDIVNPTGVGNLKLNSYIPGVDSGLSELKSDELQLAGIEPGRYYRLLLRASDDAWQSPDMHFLLYRVPTFWQTDPGRALIWFLTITGVLLIVFIIIYY
ncbi:MAG: hypothetical protein K8F30_00350, partial [Taibaiella sp.]|nr:hypothetical protein [Taibaiella sp.]